MEWLSSGSYWHITAHASNTYPPLRQDVEADVVVIGGGITGLTAAMHLKRAGRRVVLLEAGRVGAGATGGTSGHLDALPDQGAEKLIRDHGKDTARCVTEARMGAIDEIEAWCCEFGIDCGFARIPAYLYSESPEGARRLVKQLDAVRQLGLPAEPVEDARLPFDCAGGLRIEHQGRFHPLRYVRALAQCFHGDGCSIHEQTRARPPEDGSPCVVETEHGRVIATDVLLCTHSAFLGISELDLRVAPYQSYVLLLSISNELPDALYWDDASPYHYLRRADVADPRLIIIGGNDHKTGQGGDESDSFRKLENYARERFEIDEIRARWSAELFESSDGLPFIGRVPFTDHVYVSTGLSGTGLTLGAASGRILTDLLLHGESALSKAVSPSRLKPMAAAANLLSENLNVAKRFVMDRLGPSSIKSLAEIGAGCGRLVRHDGEVYAAYRDDGGMLTLLSPACTHAGCYVQWNEAEKTWDCPCHGGRYSAVGERLYGPAPDDLERVSQGES